MLRIFTALVLLALLALALWMQPWAFALLVATVVALAWREFACMAAEAGAAPLRGIGAPLAVACALAFRLSGESTAMVVFGAAAILATMASLAAGKLHPGLVLRRSLATVGGFVWLGLMPGFYVALRNRPEGLRWLLLLFVAVSTGDIAAYYGGRLLGRHPLAPSLSPHKTLEGTGFGLAASMVAAGAVGYYQIPAASLPRILALGLLLGAVGQCGDLFESALKRAAGAKDSSTLLPGHGGILDRIDSLLFAGATLYAALATKLI